MNTKVKSPTEKNQISAIKKILKKFPGLKYFILALPILILLALEILSMSAAAVFNYAMERQNMLLGSVTAEKISADITGQVEFTNLEWKDMNGRQIIYIPDGSFRVRLYDILTKNFKSTTVQELTINDANISLRLDDDMRLDFVGHSPDFEAAKDEMKTNNSEWEKKIKKPPESKSEEEMIAAGEARRAKQKRQIEEGWQNFNRNGQKIKLKLEMNQCQVEVFFKERHYLFGNVNIDADVDTSRAAMLAAHTGVFGGTMIGRGFSLRGSVNFADADVPTCNFYMALYNVNPSSLGFGLKIDDAMTLKCRFEGEVSHPVGRGTVQMDELHLPGLDFSNVMGKIAYKDSMLLFEDVTANVYGGELKARGDYNMDTRYYNLYGHGEKLKAKKALKKSHLSCDVALDLTIKSKGNARNTVSYGEFASGEGRYGWIPFKEIKGKFNNAYRDLQFSDVAIDLGGHYITTDAFSIKDGKLTLAPIKLTDDNGRLLLLYDQGQVKSR